MLIGIIAAVSAVAAALSCVLTDAFLSLAWLWQLPVRFVGSFLVLAILYFLFLWLCCALVDMEKPQEKDSKLYRWLFVHTAKAVTQILLMKVHTKGLEKLPKEGRFLMVCNHIHDLDPVTLGAFFPKSQLAFISKRENDQKFLVGKILHKILGQPINRENDREALKTILKCIDIIKEDKASIAVFPEGYVSDDKLLHPFRSGVFKIALRTHVPIVVCTLQNTQHVFHNGLRLRPTNVEFHVVGVVQPEEYQGMTAVQVGNMVHDMMAEDLGPDLVLPVEETP